MALFAKNIDDDKRPALYRLDYKASNNTNYVDIFHNKTKLDHRVRELLKTAKQLGCTWAVAKIIPLFRDKETGMCLPAPFEAETTSGFGLK